jgi:hypothetical protein
MNQELNVSIKLSTVATVAPASVATPSSPQVLDQAALAQIAGGVRSGPNGGW